MKYLLNKTYYTGQESMIKNRGDALWELICEAFMPDQVFTITEIVDEIVQDYGHARRTAQNIAYALVANLVAMPEGGLFKVGKRHYRFHDLDGK